MTNNKKARNNQSFFTFVISHSFVRWRLYPEQGFIEYRVNDGMTELTSRQLRVNQYISLLRTTVNTLFLFNKMTL